jgi:trehalose 6-phosphate phosphatase
MKYILAARHRALLEYVASSRVLLALDFDGTLSPIVASPEAARLSMSTRALLAEAAQRYPCAVISGRSREDILARLRGLPVFAIVGNHGIEHGPALRPLEEEVARWVPRLRRAVAAFDGIMIEDKGLSVAIHYRRCRKKRLAVAAVRKEIERLGQLRIVGGKEVLNLLPAGAPHKGAALEIVRARARCERAIFVGDDETDEDAFALASSGRVLAVRVSRRHRSFAPFYLRHRGEVDDLLSALVELRPAPFPDWRIGLRPDA